MYGVSLYKKAVDDARDDQARKENKKPEEITDPDLSGVNFEKPHAASAGGDQAQPRHVARALLPRPDLPRHDKPKEAAEEFSKALS